MLSKYPDFFGFDRIIDQPDSEILSFRDEIQYVNKTFPEIKLENVRTNLFASLKVDIPNRRFRIELQSLIDNDIPVSANQTRNSVSNAILRINVEFPDEYPRVNPVFDIQVSGTVSMAKRMFLTNAMNAIASCSTIQGQWCLESCIKFLLTGSETLIDVTNGETFPFSNGNRNSRLLSQSDMCSSDDSDEFEEMHHQNTNFHVENFGRYNVPFPRSCSAIFSRDGK